MILCDTNVLIEFYKNNSQIITDFRQIGLRNLAVSVITIAELYYGALNKAELSEIKKHLALMHQIPVTRDISQRFLGLMENYALSHRPGVPDMLIAATAMNLDMSLFTLNVKDFRFIPDLTIYKQTSTS